MGFCFTGYNQAYMEETDRKVSLPLAKRIYAARWQLVCEHCFGGTLLDYGCAGGAFHQCAPDCFEATGWDINPSSQFSGQPPTGHYDIVTMWDVMEHLPAPLEPVIRLTPDTVFISTPDADNTTIEQFTAWKHYKPVEHLYYFTPQTLTMSMASIGYKLSAVDHHEGLLRDPANYKAIFTAVYAKAQTGNC